MSAIRYPVAANPEAALSAPVGRAAREREAQDLAGAAVTFESQMTGPLFETRDAALDAWGERVGDDRPGRGVSVEGEDRYCQLREVVAGPEGRWPVLAPVEPIFEAGRRWPKPGGPRLPVRWRLSVSYWRIVTAEEAGEQARAARRRPEAAALSAEEVRALARRPLRPVRPQQPLDSGLFEMPAPEAPHILIPDE